MYGKYKQHYIISTLNSSTSTSTHHKFKLNQDLPSTVTILRFPFQLFDSARLTSRKDGTPHNNPTNAYQHFWDGEAEHSSLRQLFPHRPLADHLHYLRRIGNI